MPEVATVTTPQPVPLTAPAIQCLREELHRWLMRRFRNADTADDMTQEVFLRLCRMEHADRIRDPLSYLFRIAFTVISAHRSAESRSRVISYNSDEAQLAGESLQNALNDEAEEQLDLERRLELALAQLPVHYQTVVILCKVKGMSYAEAAADSGLSVHTVEKYLVRARAQLTALMCNR